MAAKSVPPCGRALQPADGGCQVKLVGWRDPLDAGSEESKTKNLAQLRFSVGHCLADTAALLAKVTYCETSKDHCVSSTYPHHSPTRRGG